MNEDAALYAIVRGRVQGVGFRYFVERQAGALGLSGWVRNREDGVSVEVVAEGSRQALESLLEDLRRGPRMAYVEDVNVEWRLPKGGLEGFGVRF